MGTPRHGRPDGVPRRPVPANPALPPPPAVPPVRPRPARHASVDEPPDPFRILIVCTGNVHRSPMARCGLVAALGAHHAPVEITSAGTRAVTGAPMADSSVAALQALGVPVLEHSARLLQPVHVERADLVLTAEEGHARDILAATPAALRRTYTLLEFVRVSTGLEPLPRDATTEDRRRQVFAIAARRGLVPRPTAVEDVPDPQRQNQRRTETIAASVVECVRHVAVTFGLD